MTTFLINGSDSAKFTLLLAPGAGAPMTNAWMNRMAGLIAEKEIRVVRFDFAYMTARQETGSRKPPPKAETLVTEYEAAVEALAAPSGRIFIGGKSLGGRVASMAAQNLFERGRIAGLVCLGYPFHPPDKPDQLRTPHLMTLTCPTLIVQGERDPFGGRDEVASYGLPASIAVHWALDGDHDLSGRRSAGASLASNMAEAAALIAQFSEQHAQAR